MAGRMRTAKVAQERLWRQIMRLWDDPASRFELATEYTTKYSDNFPGWVALAGVLVRMARYKPAHRALLRAQKLWPPKHLHQLHVQWGRFYDESGDLKQAEESFRRAVRFKATTSTLTFLGAVLARQGRFSEAKQCHRRAARLGGKDADEPYLNLGYVLRAERRYKQALECFEKALKLDPKYREAKEARADVLHAMRLKKTP